MESSSDPAYARRLYIDGRPLADPRRVRRPSESMIIMIRFICGQVPRDGLDTTIHVYSFFQRQLTFEICVYPESLFSPPF